MGDVVNKAGGAPARVSRKRMWFKALAWIIAALLAIVALAYLREFLKDVSESVRQAVSEETGYAEPVSSDDPLLLAFVKQHPDRQVILACAGDVNDDGRDDLVCISHLDDKNYSICMVSAEDGSYTFTEPIPAPKENQKVKFLNIDKGSDLEVLITGEKDGQVGYAVYKVGKNTMRDLYGEGMKDCC